MFAKCLNLETPVVLLASNIEDLSNHNLVDALSPYLPNYINFNGANLIELRQLSFSPLCIVKIDNIEFIFKFIKII